MPAGSVTRNAANDAQLTTAFAAMNPGDHVVLTGPGPYTLRRTGGTEISRSGTQAKPIVIRCEDGELLTPDIRNSWDVSGSWLQFYGLKWTAGENQINAAGFNNRLRRCDFSGWKTQCLRPYNGHTPFGKVGGNWTVDYCSFHDPLPWDVPPGSAPQPSRVCVRARSSNNGNFPYGWKFRRCHWYNGIAKLGKANDPGAYYGQTDFLEWPGDGPTHPLLQAGWLMEYCLIEKSKGKDAVLDLKCGGNVIRYVTLKDCPAGRMDNRNWHNNRWEGIWLENCGGMDFCSADHVANGVRMELGTAPVGYPAAQTPKIQIIAGSDEWNAAEGDNPRFQRGKNVKIIGAQGSEIRVGWKYSTSDLRAQGSRIEANTGCTIRTEANYAGTWDTPSGGNYLEEGTTWSATPSEPIVTPIKMTTALCGVTAPFID